jgi:hypothetical protein
VAPSAPPETFLCDAEDVDDDDPFADIPEPASEDLEPFFADLQDKNHRIRARDAREAGQLAAAVAESYKSLDADLTRGVRARRAIELDEGRRAGESSQAEQSAANMRESQEGGIESNVHASFLSSELLNRGLVDGGYTNDCGDYFS